VSFVEDMASVELERCRIALLVDCPTCGRNEAYSNRCSKCGGDAWVPAGQTESFFITLARRKEREFPEEGE
jgi:hypothetical protein